MDAEPLLRRLHDAAADQDRCVSASQLAAAGITYDTVDSLVRRGAVSRVAHGVYVVGDRTLSDRQLLWVAMLAAGPGSAISHYSAAALHGLLDPRPGEAWVTTPQRRGDRTIETLLPMASTGRPGTIRIISARQDRTAVLLTDLRVEIAASAIVGLAARESPTLTTKAWREADYRNLLRTDVVEQRLGRGVAGSTLIRQLMLAHPIVSDANTDVATRSEFKLLEAVLRLGLPRPRTNQLLILPGATYYPDLFFPDVGLVGEVDGGVHKRPSRQAADRARDEHMRQNGLAVVRVSNDEVEADAEAAARRIAVVYAQRSKT